MRSLFTVTYRPQPTDRGFLERQQTQERDGARVSVAIPDATEARRIFGVDVTARSLQPVFIRIENLLPAGGSPVRLHAVAIDPAYYTPREAASVCRFSIGKRMISFGVLAWFFLPMIGLVISKAISSHRANRRMEGLFKSLSLRLAPISPGRAEEGFVFTTLDVGTKNVLVRLLGTDSAREFEFAVAVPGLDADHHQRAFDALHSMSAIESVDRPGLVERLRTLPAATTNKGGTGRGDPVNLVVIGTFDTILAAFGSRWDETEIISIATCWRTARAFLLGGEYRYSPVSPLFLMGRSQDFALQRIRGGINERLHLRLWALPMRFLDRPVWIGQISRDIGVRFTRRTWNLTTHRIDPDVDESRDYLVEDLLAAGRILGAAYLDGVGACTNDEPRRNLTGDPYFTDGRRAVVVVSDRRTTPIRIEWW
ncbi:MAG: LssY C-terminal domain-containing protein [Phycisphaerales bacterium]|nr:LssY C-terminal domain-containing protein [Phycisphaerales bacterium]